MLRICRGRSCATAPGQCSDFQPNRRPGRGRTAGDFNGQQDGQAGGQWHIYGTQEWKRLFTSVSQRQRTTHESADRQHSERVSPVLLIRKSSVRARRGPPRICAGQKLRICFRPYRTVPKKGPKWHTLAHRVFESVGLQFEPGGANRRLCTSAARTRLRDLPNPPLSTCLWHICGTATCGTATTTRFGLRIEGALQARAALRTRRRTAGENLSPRPELPQVIP